MDPGKAENKVGDDAGDSSGTPEYACSALDSCLGEPQVIRPEQLVRPSILRIERTRLYCRLPSVSDTNGGESAILKIEVWPVATIMTKRPAKRFENVAVIRAGPEQELILANLLELYAYDFSEFGDIEIGPDGRFGYNRLALYWSEGGRHPFLVRMNGRLAGLILVKRGSEVSGDATVWDMAEFFILRGYRKRGIGTQVAHRVWKQFPGRWEVRVMESNLLALHFWVNAISKFTGETVRPTRIERGTECWRLFSFESK
jgi:predicted acetyltransferase